jgi:hypothetical protein
LRVTDANVSRPSNTMATFAPVGISGLFKSVLYIHDFSLTHWALSSLKPM